MPLSAPGPRDWSPSPPPTSSRRTSGYYGPSTYPVWPASTRPSRASNTWAWLSLLVGAGAALIAVLQPGMTDSSQGYFVSTIGLSAVGLGIQALRLKRCGRATNGFAAGTGIVLGGIATAVMVFHLVTMMMAGSVSASFEQLPFALPAEAIESAPLAAPAEVADTAPVDTLAMTQSLGSLVATLRMTTEVDGVWPAALAVTTEANSIITSSGITVGQPHG